MGGDIFLKPKEARRVNVVEQLVKGTITVAQAAGLLCLSLRHVKRIKKGVKEQGLAYLAHKNRGRKPKHAISEETRKKVIELALNDYKNTSCTHMSELLELHQHLSISSRSIRRILKQAGITNIHSHKAAQCRRSRNRMPREGMLVQIDSSPFNWLEDRGPKLNLHGSIDDATGKILGLRFEPEECLLGYMHVLWQMAENGTLSRQFYSDRHTIFFSPKKDKLTIEEELAGMTEALTQFGRMLEELGATQIPAYSPQAKGRIERLWGTLQHRLITEMRIANISTIEEANNFLPAFIERFNKRFAVEPADPEPNYLPVPKDLNSIICIKEKRKASNGSTISYQGQTYRLLDKDGAVALLRPRSTVHVLKHLDGSLSALYEGNRFSVQACTKPVPIVPSNTCESPKPIPIPKPTSNHPWKNMRISKSIKTEADLYVK
jgi:transposase